MDSVIVRLSNYCFCPSTLLVLLSLQRCVVTVTKMNEVTRVKAGYIITCAKKCGITQFLSLPSVRELYEGFILFWCFEPDSAATSSACSLLRSSAPELTF